jgi:hypothetical protein
MAREPMRVGKDSTEPVDPVSGLTPTEATWLVQAVRHARELNELLAARGSRLRYRINRTSI